MLAAALFLLSASAMAQGWRGPGGLGVELTDDGGRPVTGVQVSLVYVDQQPYSGPPPAVSGSGGRVEIGGLAEGRWRLEVTHPDHAGLIALVFVRAGKEPVITAGPLRDGAAPPLVMELFEVEGPFAPPPGIAPEVSEESRPEASEEPAPVAPPAPAEEPAPAPAEEPVPEPEAAAPESMPAPAEEPMPEPVPEPEAAAPESMPAPAEEPMPEPVPVEEPMPEPESTVPESMPAPAEEPMADPELVEEPPADPAPEPSPAAPATPEPAPALPAMEWSVRSAGAGSCPDCRPGEEAASSEGAARPGDRLPAGQTDCPGPSAAAGRLAEAARLIASAGEAERQIGYTGPLVDPSTGRVAAAFSGELARRLEEALGPHAGAAGDGCVLVAVYLPPGSRYRGYLYGAREDNRLVGCEAGQECPLGAAAWPAHPLVEKAGRSGTLVGAVFTNWGSGRERVGRLIVYFTR